MLVIFSAWSAAADSPGASKPPVAGPPGAQAASAPGAPTDGWYFSKVQCDHDMPVHEPSPARSWEPVHYVNPNAIIGYQEMYEVTRYPRTEHPTPEQQRRADELAKKCLESVKRHGWSDFERATKDGFKLIFGDKTHYANEEYVADDRQLDPDRPEFLLFYDTAVGKRLAAFMFLARPDEPGAQIGGPSTVWHYHLWSTPKCLLRNSFPVGEPERNGRCPAGEPGQKSPEMLHVWFVKHPQGRFATGMSLTDGMKAQMERPNWP